MTPRSFLLQPAIVALTLLALALGGAGTLGAQTILAALAGTLILIAPPRGPLLRAPLIMAGLLLLLAFTAFLPAPPTDSSAWRDYLATVCHIPTAIPPGHSPGQNSLYRFPLSDTWSPQPWMSLQACSLLFVALVWALYLFQQPLDKDSRVRIAIVLIFGVALLASIAAASYLTGFHVPFWHQLENRGWFPNRNQTADVLAVVGVVNYALVFDRLRKGYLIGYLLLLALAPILTELVISYSRAGILLFFGGLLLWHLWPRRGKVKVNSLKWTALSAALGMILLAIFLTWGGETLTRFQDDRNPQGEQDFFDFRGAIQKDALRFSLESPLFGTGLGNFEPLFSFSRVASINANRAIHPESDWLWMACEMGWIGPILLVMGIVWWARRCLPLETKPGETVRLAFIVSVLVFIVHGLVDISGHCLGSMWVALLLASLALPASRDTTPTRLTPILFRVLAGMMLLLALWWACSLRGLSVPPTTATLAALKANISNSDSVSQMEGQARLALRISPLDWSLYSQLAYAEASQPGKMNQALADYQTARGLNPFWIELFINEGQVWLDADEPDLCLDAWREGLSHAGPQSPEAFRQMLDIAPPHSVVREGLAELAMERNDFLLLMLPTSPLAEADALLTHLLEVDPQLSHFTSDQRSKLFAAWWSQGNQVRLMEILHQHPEWDSATWTYQAQYAAKENDFQQACEIAAKWVTPPAVPTPLADQSIDILDQEFKNNPTSMTSGLMLYLAQVKTGNVDDALLTLAKLTAMPDHPRYLAYMESQLDAGKQDWKSAWDAWQIYIAP